jgi:hypothetical protein
MKPFISAMLALTLVGTVTARANLLSNGSFELPTAPLNWFGEYTSIPGWASTYSSIEIHNQVYPAFAGNQYVEVDVWQNSDIFQTVPTIPGQIYTLSFAYAPRPERAADTNPINVFFNGILVDSVTRSGLGETTTSWSTHSYLVTATAETSTVLFAAAGISDGYGGLLDDVQLIAVPEPSTMVLVVAGLMGLVHQRRKRATV